MTMMTMAMDSSSHISQAAIISHSQLDRVDGFLCRLSKINKSNFFQCKVKCTNMIHFQLFCYFIVITKKPVMYKANVISISISIFQVTLLFTIHHYTQNIEHIITGMAQSGLTIFLLTKHIVLQYLSHMKQIQFEKIIVVLVFILCV